MSYWLLVVLMIPFAWIWLVLHEGSHALTAKAYGYDILKFKPWPHYTNDGYFRFGGVYYSGDNKTLISIMPYVIDIIMFSVFYTLYQLLDIQNQYLISLIMAPLVSVVANTGTAVFACFRAFRGDLSKISTAYAIPVFFLFLIEFSLVSHALYSDFL